MLRFTKVNEAIIYEQFVESSDNARIKELTLQGWAKDAPAAKQDAKATSEDAQKPKAK